jgi:hypothetical protein
MTVSKTLKGIYGFLSVCLLAGGALTLALSIVWRGKDMLRNLVISDLDLTAALVLSLFLIITWFISIVGILQGDHQVTGLVVLNWALIVDTLVCVSVGCTVWFYTLRERADFSELWDTRPDTREALQDMLHCCGYFNGTDRAVSTGFCSDTTFAANATGCVTPVTKFADYTLNNIFTSIFGYMVIIVLFFLCSLCVINKRYEAERFRKIDAKRGGRGFV